MSDGAPPAPTGRAPGFPPFPVECARLEGLKGDGMSDEDQKPEKKKVGFAARPEDINRSGMTSKAKKQSHRNVEKRMVIAAKALRAQELMVDALLKEMQDKPAEILEQIKPAVNSLIADIMDRAEGKAKQSVDVTTDGESIKQDISKEVLAALRAKHGPKSD